MRSTTVFPHRWPCDHRFVRGEGFDGQPMPGLDSEALDLRAASESFAPFRKLGRRDLETLRLVTEHQGRKVPTVGGMVLFGKDRERHFPDAWIQAGRFGGSDKTRFLDRIEIRSIPVRGVEEAIAFMQKHAWQGAEIGPVRRKDRWSLPPEAVREAVINAVVHTDYAQRGVPIRLSIFDDRLEIENPGLLPFGRTIEDLPHGVAKLRNRVIGRTFHAPGLIEQWGSGVQRMTAACRAAGLAAPVFEELATRFRVTIRTTRVGPASVDETDQAILESLGQGQGLATSEIAVAIGLSHRATRTRLARLVGRGLVREIGTGPQDPQRRYFLAEGGRHDADARAAGPAATPSWPQAARPGPPLKVEMRPIKSEDVGECAVLCRRVHGFDRQKRRLSFTLGLPPRITRTFRVRSAHEHDSPYP